jgi:hypothetical protein
VNPKIKILAHFVSFLSYNPQRRPRAFKDPATSRFNTEKALILLLSVKKKNALSRTTESKNEKLLLCGNRKRCGPRVAY